MIGLIKKCLQNKDKKNFMAYCHFLCSDFKIQGFSQMWDGDIKIIQYMTFKFFTFAKKIKMNYVPKVMQYEFAEITPILRDEADRVIKNGVQESLAEKINKNAEAVFDANRTREMNIAYKKKDIVQHDRAGLIPELDYRYSRDFRFSCYKCPFGFEGRICRKKYCPPEDKCRMCRKGIKGMECRVRYCQGPHKEE